MAIPDRPGPQLEESREMARAIFRHLGELNGNAYACMEAELSKQDSDAERISRAYEYEWCRGAALLIEEVMLQSMKE